MKITNESYYNIAFRYKKTGCVLFIFTLIFNSTCLSVKIKKDDSFMVSGRDYLSSVRINIYLAL